MGILLNKAYYVDRSQVEWTIFCGAQGEDVLSVLTHHTLDYIPPIECRTAEFFRTIVKAYVKEKRPKQLAYIATICGLAIKVHRQYKVPVRELVNIICQELRLPWIITM